MKIYTVITTALIALGLSACHSDGYEHDDTYYEDDYHATSHPVSHVDASPELTGFYITDTYERSSEFEPNRALAFSPYVNNGHFEINWEVTSYHEYRVELIINDRPQLDNGVILSSSWCGRGEDCGNYSYQSCYYSSDFTIACERPESHSPAGTHDISPLMDRVPDELYLMLEICDDALFYCEYQTQRITLE